MRDLFAIRAEVKENKLDFLMELTTKLNNKINELNSKTNSINIKQNKIENTIQKQNTFIEQQQKIINQQKEMIEQIKQKQNSHEIYEETIEENEEIYEEEKEQNKKEIESEYIMINKPAEITIKEEKYRNPLEIEAIKSVTKNKKSIIKQKILAIASKQKTTAKQVKELIVDKYKYCSKATFYRYLSELKKQHKIETISINDKEYVCNISIDRKNLY